ncbi:MAG: multidrug effflux MFS transporter [Gammaproteobacteria bacterium]
MKFLLSLSLMLLYSFAFDIYLPVLPTLVNNLHVTYADMQLAISVFYLATAFVQLLGGVIYERLGRGKLLSLSLVCYLCAAIGCAFATSFAFFIGARLLQGLGAGGCMLAALAMVQGNFSRETAPKVYGYLNLLNTLSPVIGPILGGIINLWFGWQAVFGFLFFCGVCTSGYIVYCLRHLPAQSNSYRHVASMHLVKIVLTNRVFWFFMIATAIANAVVFSYFCISPYVYTQQYHIADSSFVYYFSTANLMIILGHFTTVKIVNRFKRRYIIRGVYLMMLLISILLIITTHSLHLNVDYFWLGSGLLLYGSSMLLSVGTGAALELYRNEPGMPSAILTFTNAMFAFSIATSIVTLSTQMDFVYALVAAIILMLAIIASYLLLNGQIIDLPEHEMVSEISNV